MDVDSKQNEESRDTAGAAGWRYAFEWLIIGAIAEVAGFLIRAATGMTGWIAYGIGAVLAMVLYRIYSGKP